MSRILQRTQAGIAAFALPLLMSSAALTFEMNVNPDGVRGGGPCSEASEPCSPRQTRPGVPGVSPALTDVLGLSSSHRNRNNARELHWIYSEGRQTNYPNAGSGFAVQSLITTAAGTAVIYADGTATFTPANGSDATVPVDVYGIAGQGVGIFFSNGTAYFVPPAPGSNLGNIVADKNQVVKKQRRELSWRWRGPATIDFLPRYLTAEIIIRDCRRSQPTAARETGSILGENLRRRVGEFTIKC